MLMRLHCPITGTTSDPTEAPGLSRSVQESRSDQLNRPQNAVATARPASKSIATQTNTRIIGRRRRTGIHFLRNIDSRFVVQALTTAKHWSLAFSRKFSGKAIQKERQANHFD